MSKIFYLFIGIIILAYIGYYVAHPSFARVIIKNQTFLLETALTPEQKQKGLGDRDSLPKDHVMLFPYDHKEKFGFWMKGMRFPLDFLWIDGTTVVDISKNIQSPVGNSPPVTLQPSVPVDKIIELNAGTIDETGVKVGDKVIFKTN